jgi:Cation efflux family
MSSPPKLYPSYRLGGLSAFIPLNEEAVISTRGQRLTGLIQSRSSNALQTLSRHRGRVNSTHSISTGDEEARPALDDERRPVFNEIDTRRGSMNPDILNTPQVRSMRLIGNSNPRYRWQKYYKSDEELKKMKKPIRQYYERNNFLIAQYLYIDQLLDSSLPHKLMDEYDQPGQSSVHIPNTISEEPQMLEMNANSIDKKQNADGEVKTDHKVKRTPKNLYKLPDERTPLMEGEEPMPDIDYGENEGVDSNSPIVTVAIYINLTANILLLIGKIAVIVLTSSLSVLASLVDAVLDFLSTAIVWTTTKLISRQDQYAYPIGRRRLEPVGVLVFSVCDSLWVHSLSVCTGSPYRLLLTRYRS